MSRPQDQVATELLSTVEAAVHELRRVSDATASARIRDEAWSVKEIIGHLIDSASNNHQRFVRACEVDVLIGPAYTQDAWVAQQDYQQTSWPDLIAFWRMYNMHLARVIRGLPDNRMDMECRIGSYAPMSLAALVQDYLDHLQHHVRQIHERLKHVGGDPLAARSGNNMPSVSERHLRSVYVFVRDIQRTAEFYSLLGLSVEIVGKTFARVEFSNGMLLEFGTAELTQSYDPEWIAVSGRCSCTLNIALESNAVVDSVYHAAVSAGFAGHLAPCTPPWEARFAIILDPDGNFVGLHGPRKVEADRAREGGSDNDS